MNYFDLKKTWGLGHIEIKQPTYCDIGRVQAAVYGYYFDGTKTRIRFLGTDIDNAFLNVQIDRHIIIHWYGITSNYLNQ